MNKSEWWIDGDMSADSAGNLYATWDSQVRGRDIGWLAYSTDHGRTWKTVRVTPDTDNATHIVQVAGGRRGIAYVGWLADNSRHGYSLYLREFSIRQGWLSPIVRVSGRMYGNRTVWPGDTFGISTEPPITAGPEAGVQRVVVSWGSATRQGLAGPCRHRDLPLAAAVRPPGAVPAAGYGCLRWTSAPRPGPRGRRSTARPSRRSCWS